MAKYVSAQIASDSGSLTTLMKRMQTFRHTDVFTWGNTAMPWVDQNAYNAPGMRLIGHGGGTGGYSAFIGFDTEQRRGVVVLSNQTVIHASAVGWRILQHARLSGIDPKKLEPVRRVVGAGLALATDSTGRGVLVKSVYSGSPAAVAGVIAGSIVDAVDDVPTHGKSIAQCSTLIRGLAGTNVKLAIAKTQQNPPMTIEFRRGAFLIDE